MSHFSWKLTRAIPMNYNAYIESWHAPRERECLRQHDLPPSLRLMLATVTQWIEHYNTVRIHRRLNYRSPEEMRARVAAHLAQWTPLRV